MNHAFTEVGLLSPIQWESSLLTWVKGGHSSLRASPPCAKKHVWVEKDIVRGHLSNQSLVNPLGDTKIGWLGGKRGLSKRENSGSLAVWKQTKRGDGNRGPDWFVRTTQAWGDFLFISLEGQAKYNQCNLERAWMIEFLFCPHLENPLREAWSTWVFDVFSFWVRLWVDLGWYYKPLDSYLLRLAQSLVFLTLVGITKSRIQPILLIYILFKIKKVYLIFE